MDRDGFGSHPVTLTVQGMKMVSPKFWAADKFQVSTCNGAKQVKKWVIQELLKAYEWVQTA